MAVKIVPSFSAFTFLKEVMEGSHCEGPNSFLFQQEYDTQYFEGNLRTDRRKFPHGRLTTYIR